MLNYFKNFQTEGTRKGRRVFHIALQLLLEMFLAPTNIYRVTVEMSIETRVDLHMKCPLLSDFNRNWNVPTKF